jgi:ribosomal protein S18 acetylase RimI-like enzyme
MIVSPGFSDAERGQIAALYWQVFGQKLGRIMHPEPKALRFIETVLRPDHALTARTEGGALLGVAGFKTTNGALVGGTAGDLRRIYGPWGGAWRGTLLQLLERDTENRRFLMDGLFVDPATRGQGVGTALLAALYEEGRSRGYREIRLDVIDTNPRARLLYEREGFHAIKTDNIGLLRHLFSFEASTTMVRPL